MERSEGPGRGGSGYLGELRTHWRPLAAASAGMGAGYQLNHYTANLFAPHLIAEFGWSRSDFALLGTLGLLTLVFIPLVGRLNDMLGVRRVALIGIVSFPLTFAAFAMFDGNIATFAVITVIQTLFAAITTSSTVYSRLIAERFTAARGLALALAATTPALVGAAGSPLLHRHIEAHGWRSGYWAVAAFVAVLGLVAYILIPKATAAPAAASHGHAGAEGRMRFAEAYRLVVRMMPFRIICGAFLLCNLVYPLQSSQMKLMLLENGATPGFSAGLISLFAMGVMTGRFLCGLALDRFPAHLVAAMAMGLPGLGLLAMGAGWDAPVVMAASVALMGLSLGAESDLAAFLVIRYFPLGVYSTVLGLVATSLAVSATLGAVLVGVTLEATGSFRLYMLCASASTMVGALLFLALRRHHPES